MGCTCVRTNLNEQVAKKRTQEDDVVETIVKASRLQVSRPNAGPRATLQALDKMRLSQLEWDLWIQEAMLESILGACPDSHKSLLSGLRCYFAFVTVVYKDRVSFLPPEVNWLLAWSRLFRCAATFANYCCYVKTSCLAAGVSVEVFGHPALKRAKATIGKLGCFTSRPKMFVQLPLLERLLLHCRYSEDLARYGTLFLLAYVFLLRVPSEALGAVFATSPGLDSKSVVELSDSELVLKLQKRKNKPRGSVLRRGCWCNEKSMSRISCPVHALGAELAICQHGEPLFAGITAANALATLRNCLTALGVEQAGQYRTQDFRRGHAEDLRASGAPLKAILEAGEWRSPAFMTYLNVELLESEMVLQAHYDESDEDA